MVTAAHSWLWAKSTPEITISKFIGGGGGGRGCSVALFANVHVHKSTALFGPKTFTVTLCPVFWNVPVHSFISREKVTERIQAPEVI